MVRLIGVWIKSKSFVLKWASELAVPQPCSASMAVHYKVFISLIYIFEGTKEDFTSYMYKKNLTAIN